MKLSVRARLALAATLALAGIAPIALIGGGAGAATSPATSAMCGTVRSLPRYKHVVVIMMENHSYRTLYRSSAAPYINKLAKSCGIATNYHNVTHHSLPNYLAVTSGTSLRLLSRFFTDCAPKSCPSLVAGNNIFNQMAKRNGWMSFDESMPGTCISSSRGTYAARHNPALYYTDLSTSCPKRDISLGTPTNSQLLKHFSKEATAPGFTFVTPNLCNDMHDCSVSVGDNWLKKWLPLLTGTTVYGHHDTVVFVVWDEGESGGIGENCAGHTSDQSCHVVALVVAPSVKPGTSVQAMFNHYSLLKTAEELLGVPELGSATTATSMVSAFHL